MKTLTNTIKTLAVSAVLLALISPTYAGETDRTDTIVKQPSAVASWSYGRGGY